MLPVYYTTLAVQPGDATVMAGDELKIQVTVSGRPVRSVQLLYREKQGGEGGPQFRCPPGGWAGANSATPLSGAVTTALKNRQDDLDYRVVAGELESRLFHVKVIHPLVLSSVEAAITPPEYPDGRRSWSRRGASKPSKARAFSLASG